MNCPLTCTSAHLLLNWEGFKSPSNSCSPAHLLTFSPALFKLEDRAFKALPALLKERFGIEVQGRLIRTFLENAQGKSEEVNIYGKGIRNSSELVIIGESKSQLSKKHINRFKKKLVRLAPALGKEIFALMITYMTEPETLKKAEAENIPVFMSYEF